MIASSNSESASFVNGVVLAVDGGGATRLY
jgi:hypothetical protein